MSARVLTLFDQDFGLPPAASEGEGGARSSQTTSDGQGGERDSAVRSEDGEIHDSQTASGEVGEIREVHLEELPGADLSIENIIDDAAEIDAIFLNEDEPIANEIAIESAKPERHETVHDVPAINTTNTIENDTKTGDLNDADNTGEQISTADKPKKKKQRPVAEDEINWDIPADWKGEKQYYTIGEVAELFKVNTSHIRFWTNEFNLKVRTTRKGDRLYTKEQIKELQAIHHLVKEKGFTLTGAKAKLKEQKKRDVETIGLKTSLTQLRSKLVNIKKQLN